LWIEDKLLGKYEIDCFEVDKNIDDALSVVRNGGLDGIADSQERNQC
jgi:hypothetical protein